MSALMWEESLRRAVELHQRGELEKAERFYYAVLDIFPDSFDARRLLGVLRAQQGRYGDAIEQIEHALRVRPDEPAALADYGKVQMALGRIEAAITNYQKALSKRPSDAGLHYACANALRSLNRLEEANHSYEIAIKLKPTFTEAFNNRGGVLQNLGYPLEALVSFENALSIDPNNAEALNNRGSLLLDLKRYEEAVESCSKAFALKPDLAEALNNRASALWKLGKIDEALDDFNRAIAIRRGFSHALSNRAKLLWKERGNYDLAIRDLQQLLHLEPSFPLARGDLLYLQACVADWRSLEQDIYDIAEEVRRHALVVQPFIFQAFSSSPADLSACSKIYANREYPTLTALAPNVAKPRDRIRLGYLCGEFRAHATSYLSVGLFERHDRNRFDVIAFDNGWKDDSPTRKRLEAGFDRIIDITQLSDQSAAEKIVAEEVDVLINLNGYYGDHRMGIFARKPAPIQVNFLGFPSTLGADYMDYILADRIVIPKEEQEFYTECVAYLPVSYQVNDSKREISEQQPNRADNGLDEDAFVFCNFNHSYKLNPSTFAVWMRILCQIPDSLLWLWCDNSTFARNIKAEAGKRGISGDRIIMASHISAADHLARLKLADLFLDCLPYNGHTTASDALWAGLPILTCTGTSFAGRVATSLLYAADLPELVTKNLEEYEKKAIAIASDKMLLRSLRSKLGQSRQSRLFDTDGFRTHLEKAYVVMWERWKNGLKAESFSVLDDDAG
jgi:protein O-GlcNAc transferase